MIRKRKKGQAVVEMALVLPIFIFVLIGIVDFGRALHSWAGLNFQCVKAARAATRRIHPLIARNVFSKDTHTPLGQETNVYGVWDVFWANRSPFMDEADYNPPVFTGVGENSRTVEVKASFNLSLMTPMMGSLLGGENKSGALTIYASAFEQKE